MAAIDSVNQNKITEAEYALARISSKFRVRFNRLFDPVQTHSINGISNDLYDAIKNELKELGAHKFRKVKAHGDMVIICFHIGKMVE